jgi:hypothetical protein
MSDIARRALHHGNDTADPARARCSPERLRGRSTARWLSLAKQYRCDAGANSASGQALRRAPAITGANP